MHIFLIRHGESIANIGANYEKRIPDHLVSLTENGRAQARENGEWLANYCRTKGIDTFQRRFRNKGGFIFQHIFNKNVNESSSSY